LVCWFLLIALEIIVGNKIDLEKKIVVDENQTKNLAGKLQIKYFHVSAVWIYSK